ncbi:MAG: hypothetical protein AABX82_04230, partial [Nanoarchaeota archaeon]
MENRKDQRIKIQFTEQQKEYLRQLTQEQRFQTINEHIRYKLFLEQELKQFIAELFDKQNTLLT